MIAEGFGAAATKKILLAIMLIQWTRGSVMMMKMMMPTKTLAVSLRSKPWQKHHSVVPRTRFLSSVRVTPFRTHAGNLAAAHQEVRS